MNRTNKGIVTLSFDCEAKWGMADLSLNWTKELTDKNLVEVYEYILEILKKGINPLKPIENFMIFLKLSSYEKKVNGELVLKYLHSKNSLEKSSSYS